MGKESVIKIFRILVFFWVMGFCPTVRAQDMMNAVLDVNSHIQSSINFARTMTLNSAVETAAKNATSSSSSPTNTNLSIEALRFQPSTAVSQKVRNDFIEALQKANPQSADAIEQKLKQQDVIGDFSRDMAPYGLRADDVADTLTAYWLTMWIVANQEEIPSVDKVQAVRNQVRKVMLNNNNLVQATEAARQEIAEITIYETMIAWGLLTNANHIGDRVKLQQLADSAYKNMLEQGLDLRSMELTSNGFISR